MTELNGRKMLLAGLKGEPTRVVSTVLVGQDEDGGNVYEQTFDNGTKARFVAPRGERGLPSDFAGGFALDVDNDGNLCICYRGEDEQPDVRYDEETGDIYLVFEGVEKKVGNLREIIQEYIAGNGGGVVLDIPFEKGKGENSLQQVGSSATGDYSFARGAKYVLTESTGGESVSNEASGTGATAEGAGTIAIGDGSHAEGSIGKPSVEGKEYRPTTAKQRGAHAEGCGTLADGNSAHSEGYATEATAEGAHAEGKRTKATAECAHAEGKGHWDSNTKTLTHTVASGEAAHAEGLGTKAIGRASHSEGLKGQAQGNHSHVEGSDGKAYGNNSHVEGWSCKTYGGASHAGGEASIARGYASFAHGVWTEAKSLGQAVVGLPNEDNSDAVFIVGNGDIDENYEPTSRSNAFEVMKDGTARVGGKQVATIDDIPSIDDVDLSDYYTKTQSDSTFAKKSDLSNHYTKSQSDSTFAKKGEIPNVDLSDYYTKSQSESTFAKKGEIPNVDLSNYYTKTQSESTFAKKSDLSNYYTKTQIATNFASKSEIPDTSKFATKSEVNNMVTTPLSGFFTMKVDTDGNLYAYSAVDLSSAFKYVTADNQEDGEEIGNLYYITED